MDSFSNSESLPLSKKILWRVLTDCSASSLFTTNEILTCNAP
ncbi:hypothetical protein MtrunA17_Chr7g0252061 [Medicago truncatula]|uniref:Uncharacterized protein n=1 Tax=Medicago truncatula TaxID=3880 RepID=A0A396H1W7_MEDTR|nr:hypothetical protein MtrunA17_Chr7g0252061 [Medicago truncatula]